MRRLLLLPACALVLLGAPVLALQQPAPAADPTSDPAAAAPSVEEVPLPSAQEQTVQPGFEEEVARAAELAQGPATTPPTSSTTRTRSPTTATASAASSGSRPRGV